MRRNGFELFNGGRAVDVAGDSEHFLLALVDQVFGQLGGGGSFTGALKTGHQNHGWWLHCQIDVADALTHSRGQFLVDDADQNLAGLQGSQHFTAECFFFDPGDEVAHHRQRDIGLQQSHAHFAQHFVDIVFRDTGLSPQSFDQSGQFVSEGGGHSVPGWDSDRAGSRCAVADMGTKG